jgi:hypothetical protein
MDAWKGGRAVLLLLVLVLSGGTAQGFHLSEREGLVVVEHNGKEQHGTGDYPLSTGDTIRVEGNGFALLRDASGQSLTLAEGSSLAFSSIGKGRQAFRMVSGLVRITSDSPSKVTAPYLQLWTSQADFFVYVVQDVTSVFVLSGFVMAENAAGESHMLSAGTRFIATSALFQTGSFDPADFETLLRRKETVSSLRVLSGSTAQGNGGGMTPLNSDPQPNEAPFHDGVSDGASEDNRSETDTGFIDSEPGRAERTDTVDTASTPALAGRGTTQVTANPGTEASIGVTGKQKGTHDRGKEASGVRGASKTEAVDKGSVNKGKNSSAGSSVGERSGKGNTGSSHGGKDGGKGGGNVGGNKGGSNNEGSGRGEGKGGVGDSGGGRGGKDGGKGGDKGGGNVGGNKGGSNNEGAGRGEGKGGAGDSGGGRDGGKGGKR